ncbi:hypothetical protein ACRALDRAFT_1074814 [Sodiomyces alcalophilus JCM 7366]|uniref:uncharacterized protein n=1 Tax=Sodiomyces alcalophilus JCM 7366 TaxID=591952 RepID=UPI0039B6299A
MSFFRAIVRPPSAATKAARISPFTWPPYIPLSHRPPPTIRTWACASSFPRPPTTRPTAHLLVLRRRFSQTTTARSYIHKHDPEERLRHARPLLSTSTIRRTARSPRTKTVVIVAVAAAVIFYFSNLQTVPVSGRRRFNCFSDEAVAALSAEQVRRIEYEVERQGGRFLPDWDPRVRLVKRVMKRLIAASGGGELPTDAQGETMWGAIGGGGGGGGGGGNMKNNKGQVDWEVRVIDDPHTMNAFVLPGGKVFVHSGILRATRSESGLAAVLGHEIAHNMASHVGERMSSAIGINILLYSLFFMAYMVPGGMLLVHSLGGNLMDILFSMPMSRMQETEADYIGLMIMAEACYDPREAVGFWRRMEAFARSRGEDVPELLSTHPSNQNRIEKVESWLPEAMERWHASDCYATTSYFADSFRRAMARGVIMM